MLFNYQKTKNIQKKIAINQNKKEDKRVILEKNLG